MFQTLNLTLNLLPTLTLMLTLKLIMFYRRARRTRFIGCQRSRSIRNRWSLISLMRWIILAKATLTRTRALNLITFDAKVEDDPAIKVIEALSGDGEVLAIQDDNSPLKLKTEYVTAVRFRVNICIRVRVRNQVAKVWQFSSSAHLT